MLHHQLSASSPVLGGRASAQRPTNASALAPPATLPPQQQCTAFRNSRSSSHCHIPTVSHRRLGTTRVQAADTDTQQAEPSSSSAQQTSSSKDVPTSPLWEIDFCSRPLLDERGKKVWELLICDPERNFEYSQYFPNSKINSAEVSRAAGWWEDVEGDV